MNQQEETVENAVSVWSIYLSYLHQSFHLQIYNQYYYFIKAKSERFTIVSKKKWRKNGVPEYLVLLKLNPGSLIDTLGAIRSFSAMPVPGVDICYSMNIFGVWDVGIWINADNSGQVLEFVQNKVKDVTGVSEVYTVPTFPHANRRKEGKAQETKNTEN